ncbi:MAG: acetyl-CoA carboxylase, carboxyltransferase subunit beta [Saprospiraceae bacterium]
MSWFKRLKEGIQTATKNKKETPDGVWHKCPKCNEMTTVAELQENAFICPKCDFHTRISSQNYFDLIFDGKYTRMFDEIHSVDMLEFKDVKTYISRLEDAYKKTQLNDSMSVAVGKVQKYPLCIACMDFGFIGGSMGSVVGEKISRAIDYCIENSVPFMIISKSGGARMMESAFSLMQMAKTSAKLTQLAKKKVPYLSFMTDPTTGGVTASFAMLGDLNFAEPNALIGFAGPRVIKETIKKDLPEGFQTSEYLLEHGFLDFIVHRKELKTKLGDVLALLQENKKIEGELIEDV